MTTYNKITILDFVENQFFGYQDHSDLINNILFIIERFGLDHTEDTGIHNAYKLSKRCALIHFSGGFASSNITTKFSKNMSLKTGTSSGNPSTGKFVFTLSGGNADTNGYQEGGLVQAVAGTSNDSNVNQTMGTYNSGNVSESNKSTECTAVIREKPSATWTLTNMDFFICIFTKTTVTT